MFLTRDRARLLRLGLNVKTDVAVRVIFEERSLACVRQTHCSILLLNVSHLIARCIESCSREWDPARRFLTRYTSLHIQPLSAPPQAPHFSIAGVFDDGKAIPVFPSPFE